MRATWWHKYYWIPCCLEDKQTGSFLNGSSSSFLFPNKMKMEPKDSCREFVMFHLTQHVKTFFYTIRFKSKRTVLKKKSKGFYSWMISFFHDSNKMKKNEHNVLFSPFFSKDLLIYCKSPPPPFPLSIAKSSELRGFGSKKSFFFNSIFSFAPDSQQFDWKKNHMDM